MRALPDNEHTQRKKKGVERRFWRIRIHRLGRLRRRKKNLVQELHHKTIADITRRADVVMLPYFDTQNMMRHGADGQRRRPRKSNRAMRDLNHSLFRQRLITTVETQGKVWTEAPEAYTTKTCGEGGHINRLALTDRVFVCRACKFSMDRDVHSSMQVFVRNVDVLHGV